MCLDGWVGGWMDGWVGGSAGFRIAYSNQKYFPSYLAFDVMYCMFSSTAINSFIIRDPIFNCKIKPDMFNFIQ